jgi:NADH-quinone oxidoreductase subunit F
MPKDYPQVLFQNRKPDRIATLDEYRQSGGYSALARVLTAGSHAAVRQQILDAVLLGRGGAAFPAGKKMETIADDAPFPRYMVCNADEMESGTFKDRVLIHADPHMLIEGMIIAAYGILADEGVIFIRPEYESAAKILEREIRIARAAGYLGKNILGSGYALDIVVHRSGGRYICGEVTAQLNALMGKRPIPKQAPPYPTEKGLWDRPTLVNNVETLACVPHIIRHGADWFKGLALTVGAAGTKIFCVSGHVNRPGCYELPLGVPLSEIIEEHAGGMRNGAEFKACLPGGASTRFMPKPFYDIEMDFGSLKKRGSPSGNRGHHGLRPHHLHGGCHYEPDRLFCSRVLRLVHALPGGSAVYPRPAGPHRSRGGRRSVHVHVGGYEPPPVECLLRFRTGGRVTAGEPFDLFRRRGAGTHCA